MDTVDYPVLFRDADEASLAGQRRYVWLVRTDLICVVSAAVLGVVGSLVNGQSGTIVVLATVVVLLGAFTARLVNRILRDERAWFDGRALAESAKSLTWQFVMRAGPFKVDDEAAERRFIGDLWDLRRERKDLRLSSSQADENVGQITSKMQEIRAQDLQARRIVYLPNVLATR